MRMEEGYESKYHSLEEQHWWFRARRNLIERIAEKMPLSSRVLDIGCSGGVLLKSLGGKGFENAKGVDISETAIKKCRQNGLKNVKLADASKTGFLESFDLIIASDILEHIKTESLALKEWNRLLSKKGKLIVFVPAFGFLWSSHDVANRHFRRYSKKSLTSVLRQNGFEIEQAGYWNFFLFIPIALSKLCQMAFSQNSGSAKDQLKKTRPLLNSLLLKLLLLENWLISKKVPFPFGVSAFAIAKKT